MKPSSTQTSDVLRPILLKTIDIAKRRFDHQPHYGTNTFEKIQLLRLITDVH
ncbi:MAG: hypothetical protein GY866_13185 [Proteobacteria bacterium]|nr:hypothetical protein [Pseudomonadota bacterium]